jgi:hypothetical protein
MFPCAKADELLNEDVSRSADKMLQDARLASVMRFPTFPASPNEHTSCHVISSGYHKHKSVRIRAQPYVQT